MEPGGAAANPSADTGRRLVRAVARREEPLPAHQIRAQLLRRLESDRVCFVQGYTGSGKSSQIPQMLLVAGAAPWAPPGTPVKVLCTQPRRLAVAAVATRVAQERGARLGTEVSTVITHLVTV
jgi:ATP-dependent RNA helicase DDX35